jgi:hypothetical protein
LESNSCLLSGGAPDSPCSCLVRDLLPFQAHPTVAVLRQLAHRTLSGAHRSVRCPLPTVGSHAQSTVGFTGQSGAPPDSPVNFSCTPLIVSRERRLRRRRPTGQSGAPPDSPVIYSRTPSSSPESRLFTETGPGAPDTVRCTQTELHFAVHSQLFSKTFSPVSSTWTQYISLQNNVLSLETYLVP